jgi:hypothetical protein
MTKSRYGLVMLLAGIGIQNVSAQDEIETDIVKQAPSVSDRQKVVILKKRTKEEDVKGLKAGDFTYYPSVSLVEYYDDNIYATENNTRDDFVTVIVPSINIESNWKEDSLKASAGAQLSRYADFSTENANDYWLDLSGRLDIDRGKNLFGAIGYEREHEDRASPESTFGEEPTRYDLYSGNAGYVGWSGNHQIKVAYTLSQYDFMDVPGSGGVIFNDDRDRNVHGLGFRYMYHYSDAVYPYIQVLTDKCDYKLVPDYAGYERDSDGLRANIGLHIRRKNTASKIFVGKIDRDYSDSRFEDPSETDYGLRHTWRVTDKMNLILNVSRSIEETTFSGSPAYLVTDSNVQWRQKFGDRNLIKAIYSRADVNYYQITRDDLYENYVLGYSRRIVDELFVNIDLQHGTRDSNVSGDDYTINQLYFGIKAVI